MKNQGKTWLCDTNPRLPFGVNMNINLSNVRVSGPAWLHWAKYASGTVLFARKGTSFFNFHLALFSLKGYM